MAYLVHHWSLVACGEVKCDCGKVTRFTVDTDRDTVVRCECRATRLIQKLPRILIDEMAATMPQPEQPKLEPVLAKLQPDNASRPPDTRPGTDDGSGWDALDQVWDCRK